MQGTIKYLDYNATTPVHPEVLLAMEPFFLQKYGNASSNNFFGWEVEESVEKARQSISNIIGVKASDLFFFSSATEALNAAIIGYALNFKQNPKHIITCKTEHNAVLKTCEYLETEGFDITYLDVNNLGLIDPQELLNAIQEDTIMICLMLANNETGVIHPIKELIELTNNEKLIWITDATSAFGKFNINFKEINVDLAVFSGHKVCGPKGIAVLYKKSDIFLKPIIHGGLNEKGLRAGTLNVPAIIGLEKAIEINNLSLSDEETRLEDLRNKIENELLPFGVINGYPMQRVSNTSNFQFKNIDYSNLLKNLNRLAISQGAACSANTTKPSHVLRAMGLSEQEAFSSIRISIGRFTTTEDIDFTINYITKTIARLKA